MTEERYYSAVALAGDWARGVSPRPICLASAGRAHVRTGVYIACDCLGVVLYVGSACRPMDPHGVGTRVAEHPVSRRRRWASVWLIPLHDDTPNVVVHAIEGAIIALLAPAENRRQHSFCRVPARFDEARLKCVVPGQVGRSSAR